MYIGTVGDPSPEKTVQSHWLFTLNAVHANYSYFIGLFL